MPRKGIQLAYPFEEKRLAKWKPPYILQPKLDGERCRSLNTLLFPDAPEQPSRSMLVSSEENPFFSVPHIGQAIVELGLNNVELDGELYCHGLSFEEIHSRVSREVNIHPDYESIEYYIFDIIDEGKCQAERLLDLQELSLKFKRPLRLVHSSICNNLEELMKEYDRILSNGYEGIIIRSLDAPYIRRRSTFIMKFKPKKSDTYKIKGYSEELSIDNVLKNTLGRIICASEDTDIAWLGLYPPQTKLPDGYFGVGTGFSNEERSNIWKDPEILEGKFVKVSYQHLTSGKKVPRFPVFVEIIEGGEDADRSKGD